LFFSSPINYKKLKNNFFSAEGTDVLMTNHQKPILLSQSTEKLRDIVNRFKSLHPQILATTAQSFQKKPKIHSHVINLDLALKLLVKQLQNKNSEKTKVVEGGNVPFRILISFRE